MVLKTQDHVHYPVLKLSLHWKPGFLEYLEHDTVILEDGGYKFTNVEVARKAGEMLQKYGCCTAMLILIMDHPSTSLTFDAEEELWLGRGPQSPSSINFMRDGPFRSEHSPYRLDFTNISRVDGATRSLIAEGVYGVEFAKRLRYSAAHELNVKNVLEVLPDPNRRITVAEEKDAMGIPKPQAHYSIDDYTRKGHERSKQDFKRIAELMGGTNLRYSKEGDYANNQHICGTLSMGHDPKSSVCDQWGRAHDHENLYFAGTAVLPTASTCNSTENGLAVALRTAHHILAEQGGLQAPVAVTKPAAGR